MSVAAFPKSRLLGLRWPQERPPREPDRPRPRTAEHDALFDAGARPRPRNGRRLHRRSARPRRPDQPRHHAAKSTPTGRASRSTENLRALQGRTAAHPGRDRARHLLRALLAAGALRRAGAAARLLPLRRRRQPRRHRRNAAAAARRRHRRRRRDRPDHARRHRRGFPSTRRCSATPKRAARATARCTTSGASGAGGSPASTRRWRAPPTSRRTAMPTQLELQPTNRKDQHP